MNRLPTKIFNRDVARDGGTVRLTTDAGVFWIDRRIHTQTKGAVYDDYPDRGYKVTPLIAMAIHSLHDAFENSKNI